MAQAEKETKESLKIKKKPGRIGKKRKMKMINNEKERTMNRDLKEKD